MFDAQIIGNSIHVKTTAIQHKGLGFGKDCEEEDYYTSKLCDIKYAIHDTNKKSI